MNKSFAAMEDYQCCLRLGLLVQASLRRQTVHGKRVGFGAQYRSVPPIPYKLISGSILTWLNSSHTEWVK